MPHGRRAGYDVAWREDGTGDRPALLAHCSLAHSGAFKGLMTGLAPHLRMLAFDQPGHGRSGDWTGAGAFQDAVVDIAAAFLDDMGGGVDLIGHSFGGTALLRVAAEQMRKVRSLILIEPPFYAAAYSVNASEMQVQEQADAPFAAAHRAGDRRAAAQAFQEAWGGGGAWDDLPPEQQSYMIQRMHLIEGAGLGLNADRADLLRPGGLEAIDLPVLLIRGDRSPPSIAAIQRVLSDRLPRSEEVVISGAGHMLPITHAGAVGTEIAAFLSRT